ncbi:MAG: glycosyltransferase family 2 protein [Alphaproteobacteria bacterium]
MIADVVDHFWFLAPMPSATPQLSVVVPCYNEAGNLRAFAARMAAACEAAVGGSYEIIVVNDGSTDASWMILRELQAGDRHWVAVDLARNHGQQAALTAGLRFARGAAVLIIDADLQDPPELLPAMLEKLVQGADVVYGQRRVRTGEGWFKRATAHVFYRLLGWLTDARIPPDTGDFRLLRRHVVAALEAMPEYHRFLRGMVAWIGFTQVPLLYDRAPRHAGDTHYNFAGMLRFAGDAITSFSIKPLRLALLAAGGGLALALVIALYALHAYFMSGVVPGWTSLVCMFLIFSALQLFCLGVMGEYVGRIYMQSKGRPLFIVREVIGSTMPAGAEASASGK